MALLTIPAISGVTADASVQALIDRSIANTTRAGTTAALKLARATAATTTAARTAATTTAARAAATTTAARAAAATTAARAAATTTATATTPSTTSTPSATVVSTTPAASTIATTATPAVSTTTTTVATAATAAASSAVPLSDAPVGGGPSAATNSLQAILGNLLIGSILATQAQLSAAATVGASMSKEGGVAAMIPTAATAPVLSNSESRSQPGGRQSGQNIKAAVSQMVSQMFELP
jgi:hypothetical protein